MHTAQHALIGRVYRTYVHRVIYHVHLWQLERHALRSATMMDIIRITISICALQTPQTICTTMMIIHHSSLIILRHWKYLDFELKWNEKFP